MIVKESDHSMHEINCSAWTALPLTIKQFTKIDMFGFGSGSNMIGIMILVINCCMKVIAMHGGIYTYV